MNNERLFDTKNDGKTLKRLIKYLFHCYPKSIVVIIICILLSSIAGLSASVFMEKIIDDAIIPGLNGGFDSIKNVLFSIVFVMICVYTVGLIANIIYTQLMAILTQGFLKRVRIDMFNNMEGLPIKYFDQNQRGDIMSSYTNDVDAIRQLISQSLPQLFTAILTVVSLFSIMLYYSIWLVLVVVGSIVAMMLVTKTIGVKCSKFFMAQQISLAKTEGYVEEMMHGQKVVKVFTYEKKAMEDFDELNEQLFKDAETANKYANILMPIMHNIGNILYVLIAIVGSILVITNATNLSLTGFGSLKIGVVITFLGMSKQFSQTIGQVSQQINSVVMGIAGAKRIFAIMDEKQEEDHGYVTLVDAIIHEDGKVEESDQKTGHWAWKHPHSDGTLTYTELKGDIRMFDVDFGYTPEKIVLKNVSIYAKPGQKIAFVGATGAGKTTITNLINRFYDIADGKIRYDGININKIKKSDLRKSIGIVLQDTCLFTGTVMENIRYARCNR